MTGQSAEEISPRLITFCAEIQKWLDGGDLPEWLKLNCGLCGNYTNYLVRSRIGVDAIQAACGHLDTVFVVGYGNCSYPFSPRNTEVDIAKYYYSEAENNTIWQNPARLAFIANYAGMAINHS